MKVLIEKDYQALSDTTASILIGDMLQAHRVNVSVTAGASPAGTYELVTKKLSQQPSHYSHVHFYNFDEVPMKNIPEGMTMQQLRQQFFEPAKIAEANIHPLTVDNMAEIQQELVDVGGLDVMLLGLGADGHFCGNMPAATKFDEEIYYIDILEEYPWYEGIAAAAGKENLPERFVTMGAAMILKAKKVVLIVNGKSKAGAVKRMLEEPISPDFPATVLRLHPNLVLLLDEEAASELA